MLVRLRKTSRRTPRYFFFFLAVFFLAAAFFFAICITPFQWVGGEKKYFNNVIVS
jgi:hypothetical protein